jgi:nitrite reductase/ring-hydroxylating ferredoxin subunit
MLMGQFVKIGNKSELEGLTGGRLVEAAGKSIAVFHLGGNYYAIDNTCTHRGGPLSDGTVADEEVTCPWHRARFNVKTGAALGGPAPEGVKSFPVRVTGEDIEVEVD